MNQGTRFYDYTALSCLQQCEQEFLYRHGQNLVKPEADESAFFGQVVHVGVRNVFAGTHQPDGLEQTWGERVCQRKPYLTLKYAQAVVEMYADVYSLEARAVGKQFDLVLNEHYLEWPERRLCGIVDRVVRSKADGQLYVMDLKTTGLYLSQAWFEQWRHSLQAAIYLDLVEHELALAKGAPSYYKARKEGTWVDVGPAEVVAGFWVDAIHVDRRGYPKPEDFMRVGPFPYSESLRSELRAVVSKLVREADATLATGSASKNTRACFRYNALCPYYRYCTTDSEDRADVVKMALAAGELVEEKWEPSLR